MRSPSGLFATNRRSAQSDFWQSLSVLTRPAGNANLPRVITDARERSCVTSGHVRSHIRSHTSAKRPTSDKQRPSHLTEVRHGGLHVMKPSIRSIKRPGCSNPHGRYPNLWPMHPLACSVASSLPPLLHAKRCQFVLCNCIAISLLCR